MPALPLDHALRQLQDNKVQAVEDLILSQTSALKEARENIKAAANASAQYAYRQRRDVTFAIGDMVYLHTRNLALPRLLSFKLAA